MRKRQISLIISSTNNNRKRTKSWSWQQQHIGKPIDILKSTSLNFWTNIKTTPIINILPSSHFVDQTAIRTLGKSVHGLKRINKRCRALTHYPCSISS